MDMAAIMLNGAKLFYQIVNILSPEGPMRNLMKIVPEASEKKTFKDFTIIYIFITPGQGKIIPKILTVSEPFYFFNHTL